MPCRLFFARARNLATCDSAATAAEYAILACFIALVIVASAQALGISLTHPFATITSAVSR